MNLGETITVIVVIGLSVTLMVVFPLMTTADRADDVVQQVFDTEVSKLAQDVINTGELTKERYERFVEAINSTGYACDVELEVKILDENARKKLAQSITDKIGENDYYSKYTGQLEDDLYDEDGKISLKEGDYFYAYITNPNQRFGQMLKNIFIPGNGDDTEQMASAGGMVTTDGK